MMNQLWLTSDATSAFGMSNLHLSGTAFAGRKQGAALGANRPANATVATQLGTSVCPT